MYIMIYCSRKYKTPSIKYSCKIRGGGKKKANVTLIKSLDLNL